MLKVKSIAAVLLLLLFSCGTNDKQKRSITNLPSIMIFPSDALLERISCLKPINNQGVTSYIRDYNSAFIKASDLRFTIASIEQEFVNNGYKLENLEQTLKSITNRNAIDEVTGVAKNLRSQILNTARPDIIIELDYELKDDPNSRNINTTLTYIVKALDVYTNKSIASITRAEIGKESANNSVPSLIKEDFPTANEEFIDQVNAHFEDLNKNGVEITLRVASTESSSVQLDSYCGSEYISEKIVEWIKDNALNSNYKMNKNTSTELNFSSVRINNTDPEGNRFSAYDFAKQLKKGLEKGCDIKVDNKTQSIGDALLIIE